MLNEELLNEFKKYLKKKNLSGNSITAYAGSVRLFFTLYDEVHLRIFNSIRAT